MDTKIKDEFGNAVESANKVGTAFWRTYRWYVVATAIICLGLVCLGIYIGS